MERQLRIVTLVGSLRRESYTRRMVAALSRTMSSGVSLDVVPIGSLPPYNEDDDRGSPPAPWKMFRDLVRGGDAVLFATPEYNRSIPGVLKNAIDVGSRPAGESVWSAKPAAVLSVSPGPLGGFGANHHLRQCLVFLNMPVMQQPEAYIGRVAEVIDERGLITQPAASEYLADFAAAFETWIRRLRAGG
jgi:chromate reductase